MLQVEIDLLNAAHPLNGGTTLAEVSMCSSLVITRPKAFSLEVTSLYFCFLEPRQFNSGNYIKWKSCGLSHQILSCRTPPHVITRWILKRVYLVKVKIDNLHFRNTFFDKVEADVKSDVMINSHKFWNHLIC